MFGQRNDVLTSQAQNITLTLKRPFDLNDDVPNGDKVTSDVCC